MMDIQLLSIWRQLKKSGDCIKAHSHDSYELVYYQYGRGKTTVGGHSYPFSDGSFALIPAHVRHDEYHLSDSRVLCLRFTCSAELPQSFSADSGGRIYSTLCELSGEVNNRRYGYAEIINAKMHELYWYIRRCENAAAHEKNFDAAISFLKENYSEKIQLSECARRLHISYNYFQHKFKQLTGESPQQYLIRLRLTASAELLETSELSCTEIAYRCGFSTSAQYSSLFKKAYGLTPLQFRKRSRLSSSDRESPLSPL